MKNLIFLVILLSNYIIYSQTTDSYIYKIKDMGYITIPNSMELQSGIVKEIAETVHLIIGTVKYETLENRVVFQQKGVNIGEGQETYAKIIIKTRNREKDDKFITPNSNFKYTDKELSDMSDQFISDMRSMEVQANIKLISFYSAENVKVNKKYSGLKISYIRQYSSNPLVYVEIYHIYNNDKIHEITLSYRDKDRNKWFQVFKEIFESIIIK